MSKNNKEIKTINTIKSDNNNYDFLTACAILEHRPNITNKARKEYKKHKDKYIYIHNYYKKGFDDGYKYAIERLKKHSL